MRGDASATRRANTIESTQARSRWGMRCPSCNFENPPANPFCVQCGSRLEGRCPKCGIENPSDAKFRGDCGSVLGCDAASAPGLAQNGSELRVSQDNTAVSAAPGTRAEDRNCGLRRYDGHVVQSTVMASLFRCTDGPADHPQRALYAALRMQEESAVTRRSCARPATFRSRRALALRPEWYGRFRPALPRPRTPRSGTPQIRFTDADGRAHRLDCR